MIRPAHESDAGAIAAILNHWILNTAVTFNPVPKTEAEVREMVAAKAAAGHGFFVACDAAGRVIGQASYGQFRGGVGYRTCMEHSINLVPGYRGRGTGRALMARLEDHAARAGVHVMVAGVSGDNPGGIAFHAALGYVEVGRMPEVGRKWDRWLDLVLMQKFL